MPGALPAPLTLGFPPSILFDLSQPSYRVLIVDNDDDVVDLLGGFLARRGFEVVRAEDGRRGLALLASEQDAGRDVEVVLLDLRMPGLGGMEVLARLEQLTGSPRVIVLSGFVDEDDRARLVASPLVHAVMKKPFDLFELVAAVEAAAAAKRGAVARQA